VDRSDSTKLIQNYLRSNVIVPSKRAVKQKWRENSQNQYDTKGKRTVQWADDEEVGIKPMNKEERRFNIISALRDNETGVD
jgi:hypothetical protein